MKYLIRQEQLWAKSQKSSPITKTTKCWLKVTLITCRLKWPTIRNIWDLSALRASSVVQSLQNNYGVDPKRLTAGGRGEYNPIAGNDTAAGKAKNRRTQIIITPKLDQFMDLIGKSAEKPQN